MLNAAVNTPIQSSSPQYNLTDDEQAKLSSGLNGNVTVAGDSFVKTKSRESI